MDQDISDHIMTSTKGDTQSKQHKQNRNNKQDKAYYAHVRAYKKEKRKKAIKECRDYKAYEKKRREESKRKRLRINKLKEMILAQWPEMLPVDVARFLCIIDMYSGITLSEDTSNTWTIILVLCTPMD